MRLIDLTEARQKTADLGDVLARTGGVTVRRLGGLGSDTRLTLGGLSGQQIRTFLDGIPLAWAGFPFGIANVPVNLIDRVEIYQGVVPVRFGSDALGGAIHLTTDKNLKRSQAHAAYQVGSFDTHRFATFGQYSAQNSGLVLRALAFVDSTRNNYSAEVNAPDADGRLALREIPRFHDGYAANGGQLMFGVTDRPYAERLIATAFVNSFEKEIQNNPDMSVPYGAVRFGKLTAGGNLRFRRSLTSSLGVDATLGYSWVRTRFQDTANCRYGWYGNCLASIPRGEISGQPTNRTLQDHVAFLRWQLRWTLNPDHEIRASVAPTLSFRRGDDAALSGASYDFLNATQSLRGEVFGLEYEARLFSDRVSNIAFVKGYSQHMQSEDQDGTGAILHPKRDSNASGFGDALRVSLTETLNLKASYEYATRLPEAGEVFGDGGLIARNLALSPEHSHNLNLGLHLRDSKTPAGTFSGGLLGFARFVDSQILLLNAGLGQLVHENALRARTLGLDAQGHYLSPGQYLSLGLTATWQDARNLSRQGLIAQFYGDRLPHQPYLQASADVAVQFRDVLWKADSVRFSINSFFVEEFFRAWESAGRMDKKYVVPSQLTHSAAIVHHRVVDATDVTTTFEVQNLSNARVFDYYGAQRPGRSIFLKVSFNYLQPPTTQTPQ
jgi:outer membrane receptor protein involved in Fe transport